ncbi:MAG: hypothetical protein WAK21_03495 [Candidatus Sulfotelmatobacter sp.]
MQSAVGPAALALLWALTLGHSAEAQKSIGDFHATANGQLETLYSGNYGNLEGTDTHALGLAGRGMISGDYYNPNFLSFSVLPYYGRSQDNSDMQSITNASGYNGTLNIFKGSHFPGFFNFNQTWNNTGAYGIPDVAGLATTNNNHGLNVGWSALIPGLPTLSVGFGDTGGTSSLLGSDETTASSTRNFNVGSTYNLFGYYLSGGFIHLTNNVSINGLEDGPDGLPETETANGSSNQYRFTAQGPIPYRRSSLSFGFTRDSYNINDTLGGTNYGTTDTINGNINLMFPKAPVTVTTIYTDNLLGSIEQQLVSSGEVPLTGLNTPESRSLSVEASTFVNVLPRLLVGGYVQRTQQFFDGANFGVTTLGLTVNYNFIHGLKGLTFYGGVNDNADQQGNTRAGFIGNVTYNKYVGKWQFNGFFLYNQDAQTLLVMYTTSTLNYGGTVKRQINPNLTWAAVANVTRSGFEQVAGDSNHGESFTTMLIWNKASLSGIYSKSNGVGILTSTGVVTTAVPSQLLGPGASVLYNGKSYGVNTSFYPVRHMIVSGAWSKSFGSSTSPLLAQNSGNTNYYGFAGYEYRKLIFQAGVTKFTQAISDSGTLPSMLTSFSFGVQRWFKGF